LNTVSLNSKNKNANAEPSSENWMSYADLPTEYQLIANEQEVEVQPPPPTNQEEAKAGHHRLTTAPATSHPSFETCQRTLGKD